jgi:hypothetical protein
VPFKMQPGQLSFWREVLAPASMPPEVSPDGAITNESQAPPVPTAQPAGQTAQAQSMMPAYSKAALDAQSLVKSVTPPATSAAPVQPELEQTARIDIPVAGRAVYVWAREQEARCHTRLQNGMRASAAQRGLPLDKWYWWPQKAVTEICVEAITYLRTLPTYQGEFEHIVAATPAPIAASVGLRWNQ